QYRNAQLDEIRATGARLSDTARLYQAMGTPPVGGSSNQRPITQSITQSITQPITQPTAQPAPQARAADAPAASATQ
ncbi:hypothetical protein G3N94_41235, partial [Burkholderia sp. Ac-20353]|nr:hypothetical protein [Burkholderia sp. Ac-20353]